MSDGKCMASVDGICKSTYGFDTPCSGYSTKCKMRPVYNKIETTCKNTAEIIRKRYGIVGDKE